VGGGGRGTLNNDPGSESGPEEVALDTGVGLRIVKETLEDMVGYQEWELALRKELASSF
jgi:hypothetical protein